LCKIEFFDENLRNVCSHIIRIDSIEFDYLTFEPTQIVINEKCMARRGCFARISGEISFEGIVSDIQPGKSTTTAAVRPLQALFDFDVFNTDYTDVAQFICDAITDNIISNSDTLQNKPLQITNSAVSAARQITSDNSTVNLLSLISSALTIYGIAVDCKLNFAKGNEMVIVEIKEIKNSAVIEADKDNVLERSITLGNGYGSANKIIIRKTEKDSETGIVSVIDTVPFFLHTDGSISSQDTDRITPVFWTLEDVENCDEWDGKALSKAIEKLTPQKYDNEIVLKLRKSDSIVHPMLMSTGTAVVVYYDKVPYTSILTGKTFSKDTVTLTFGCVRVALTKKLILERRNK